MERQREYFDWAAKVVEGVRGANPALEDAFDRVWARRHS
jgi:guanosine-3',5'-bis(diphosphate) 3'-pyrophosphohydrolase